jgi:hypothetical protein
MEKVIKLSLQENNHTDKIFYNIFAYIMFSSGINNLMDYFNTDSKRNLFIGITYIVISLIGFLRFNKIWFYNKPTYIKFTKEFLEIKIKANAKPKQVKWNEIKTVSINELAFTIQNIDEVTKFNLEWIPLKIANQIKFEFLQKIKEKGIPLNP